MWQCVLSVIMGTISLFIVSFTMTLMLSRACVAKELSDGEVSTRDTDDVYQQLLRRVENLEHRDQQQQTEVDALREELNTEKQRSAVLEGRLSRLQMKFAEQQKKNDHGVKTRSADKIAVVGNDVDAIRQERPHDGDTETEQQETRSIKTSGEESSRIRRHVGMPVVAFHATLTLDALHTGVHQAIVFDHVVTNIGTAYNSHAGIFIAPISGVYVFHTTVTINGHGASTVAIVHNRVPVASAYIRGVESHDISGSVQAVLHLNKGGDVMVQNMNADTGFDNFSVFSGFLLYQDDTSETIVG